MAFRRYAGAFRSDQMLSRALAQIEDAIVTLLAASGGGGGTLTDGDKGDITVASSGSAWTIDAGAVSTTKMGGNVTTAGKALLDDADAAAQRTTLGAAATSHTHAESDVTNLTTDLAGKVVTSRAVNTTGALSGGGNLTADRTLSVATNGVTNTMLAQMPTLTIKGNNSVGTANAADLTVAQVIAMGIGGGGGGATATTVEKDLGGPTFSGRFTITDAAIGTSSKVLVWQAPGPYTGKGTRADEAAMQPVDVIGVEPLAGSAIVSWQTPPVYATPNQPQNMLGAAGQTAVPTAAQVAAYQPSPAQRINKIKGNIKFTYVVFA